MESLNVKNINDEKIFNVIDPNGQGDVTNRIRPISISISQKVETINDEQVSKVTISVYWNDTWKSILDLSFDDSLRREYGKLVTDLTAIQKDIDMKQYKDAETKTEDFLKYVSNLSSKYTNIPETTNVAASTNDFVTITANKNSFSVKISDTLLRFMLNKFAKVANMDYTKANECFNVKGNNIDIYFHSPELFAKQAYMTVVKDNNVIGSYKATYDQFSKLASKLTLTPQKLGFYKDKRVGYIKNAEVVMQNIFFDSVDEAKEWQKMVDEKKKTEIVEEKSENGTETTEVKETETKTVSDEGASTSPAKEEGGLVRPSEDFAGADELPEGQPRQQEQMGQGMAASRRLNLLKKRALKKKARTVDSLKDIKNFLKEKNAVEARNYGDFVSAIRDNKKEVETIKAYGKKKVAGGYDEYVLVVYENGAYFYTELSNGKRVDEKYYKFENVAKKSNKYRIKLKKSGLYPKMPPIEADNEEEARIIGTSGCVNLTPDDVIAELYVEKQAIEGDVQEADMVPPKTETKVYLESEDKTEETIGVGDVVCIKFDNLSEGDFAKYSEFLGIPMLLIENDKEDINQVIIEQIEYPYQRVTINKDDICIFDEIKEEQVLVEDEDGDEMITNFIELPVVAKSCKIKSIKKAAQVKKKADKYDKFKNALEEEIFFNGDYLVIDDEWKKCQGKVYAIINAEREYETLPDGETSTGRTFLEIEEYMIDELMELTVLDDPERTFTKEELSQILEENRDIIEDKAEMGHLMESMAIKINEPADEPW